MGRVEEFCDLVDAIGDILRAEGTSGEFDVMATYLSRLEDLIYRLIELKERQPKKFRKLAHTTEFQKLNFNTLSYYRRLMLTLSGDEPFRRGIFSALDQLNKILQDGIATRNVRMIQHVVLRMQRVLYRLSISHHSSETEFMLKGLQNSMKLAMSSNAEVFDASIAWLSVIRQLRTHCTKLFPILNTCKGLVSAMVAQPPASKEKLVSAVTLLSVGDVRIALQRTCNSTANLHVKKELKQLCFLPPCLDRSLETVRVLRMSSRADKIFSKACQDLIEVLEESQSFFALQLWYFSVCLEALSLGDPEMFRAAFGKLFETNQHADSAVGLYLLWLYSSSVNYLNSEDALNRAFLLVLVRSGLSAESQPFRHGGLSAAAEFVQRTEPLQLEWQNLILDTAFFQRFGLKPLHAQDISRTTRLLASWRGQSRSVLLQHMRSAPLDQQLIRNFVSSVERALLATSRMRRIFDHQRKSLDTSSDYSHRKLKRTGLYFWNLRRAFLTPGENCEWNDPEFIGAHLAHKEDNSVVGMLLTHCVCKPPLILKELPPGSWQIFTDTDGIALFAQQGESWIPDWRVSKKDLLRVNVLLPDSLLGFLRFNDVLVPIYEVRCSALMNKVLIVDARRLGLLVQRSPLISKTEQSEGCLAYSVLEAKTSMTGEAAVRMYIGERLQYVTEYESAGVWSRLADVQFQ